MSWRELLSQVVLEGVLLFLDEQGLHSLVGLDARLARECFGPSGRELLERRSAGRSPTGGGRPGAGAALPSLVRPSVRHRPVRA